MVRIPARSPDLNPIENFFHLVRTKMKSDAIQNSNNIRKETYKKFAERVKKTMYEGIQQETIENLVASMPKR